MRWAVAWVLALFVVGCGDDGETPPAVAPDVVAFAAEPQVVVAGQATTVRWTWSYANAPSPEPTCEIDHGIGAIVSGGQTGVLLTEDTTYRLTCSNSAGTSTAVTSITVSTAMVAPQLDALVATPSQVVSGTPTAVTWTWTYANTPSPAPACTLDQGIGAIASGGTATVTQTAATTYTLTCTNAAGSDTAQVTVGVTGVPVAPTLATFTAMPSSVTSGVPTNVTWAWTYGNSPTPAPSCSIDQSVGPVTSGQATSVTQTTATTYTLTCTNSAGSATRTVQIATTAAPVAPALATLTANPANVTMGAPTPVTWSWTYANSPTPAPTCSLDNGVGTLTSGSSRTITLATATTFTLTCTNSAGSSTAQVSVGVTAPVAPVLGTFTVNPTMVTSGVATNVTFSWSYDNAPSPLPTCAIDQGIGTISSGSARSVTLNQATTYTLTCTNSGGSSTAMASIAVTPPVAPVIGTFTANPSYVASGVATAVTWTWTYSNSPAPAPTCAIDQNVGVVTSGTARSVTQTQATTYTLTCTNSGGSSTSTTTISIAVPPSLASFTATPSPIAHATPTTVTWTFAFANSPVPAPTCAIEHGIGTVTSGATSSITLAQARTYRLSCSNVGGTATADATVAVDECAADADVCDANATCGDTAAGYTCTCAAGYTGDGYTCHALAACDATPSLCSPDATCSSTADGYACICNDGFSGDGASCQRHRIAFVTSTTGTGNLASWTEATGTGLAAADAVCNARAQAAGLPGTYAAWLSDPTSDAYCRVHGLTGKKANRCGQASLPASAGPWVRPDGLPFAGRIDRLVAPAYEMFYPGSLDETGAEVAGSVWTATDGDGVLDLGSSNVNGCLGWTDGTNANRAYFGAVPHQGEFWTRATSIAAYCDASHHLRCLEVGDGPALPALAPADKTVFLTSVIGNGRLAGWADAGGASGLAAADNVCRARARFVGHPNADAFKAWLAITGTTATSRIATSGPWSRRDGVLVASSTPDLADGTLYAPINVTELGTHGPDTSFEGVWTGMTTTGTVSSSTCGGWTTSSNTTYGGSGKVDHSNTGNWMGGSSTSCNALQPLYCFED